MGVGVGNREGGEVGSWWLLFFRCGWGGLFGAEGGGGKHSSCCILAMSKRPVVEHLIKASRAFNMMVRFGFYFYSPPPSGPYKIGGGALRTREQH